MLEIDFRNPAAIERYKQQVESTCRMLGGNSDECIGSREVAGLLVQANTCYYHWNPVCGDRLMGRLDIRTACMNGDYDKSPIFKANLCPRKYPVGPPGPIPDFPNVPPSDEAPVGPVGPSGPSESNEDNSVGYLIWLFIAVVVIYYLMRK